MGSLIKTDQGFKEALPSIFTEGDWRFAMSWVFSGGVWRRTFDPGFVNLINNSRLINGTDITVIQGKVTGLTPVDWTLGTMSTGNGYSYSSFTPKEQVKSYRFVSEQSRHYFVSRIHVEEGAEYAASVYVDNIAIRNDMKVVSVQGETAAIDIDVDFPTAKNIKLGLNSISFRARTSGTVQLKIGAGVDVRGDADVTISRPQITKSFVTIDWQPTPIIAPFYGIRLLDSYLFPKDVLTTTDGEYHMDVTLRIENDITKPVLMFGRNDASGFSGIGFDKTRLLVYRNGSIDRNMSLSKPIPTDRLVGLKVIWKKKSNYVSDIRFYLNGELIARIADSLYSGNIDCMFGHAQSTSNNITIQSLSINLGRVLAFNIDESQGNVIWDRNKQAYLTIAGDPMINFVWIEDASPPIITVDATNQVAEIGTEARLFADAVFYSSVQWYKDEVALLGKNSVELKINVKQEDYGVYHAVFTNEFSSVSTSRVRLKAPNDTSEVLVTENLINITTENENLITTEGV